MQEFEILACFPVYMSPHHDRITLIYGISRGCYENEKIKYITRLVFSRFFDIRENLGHIKEKPTRKTCFSREMKRLDLRIYLAKFYWAAFFFMSTKFL